MTNINIKTHTQFADHCICYGFIKEIAKSYDKVFLYTKPDRMHTKNIQRVFKSIENVVITNLSTTFDLKIECGKDWYKKAQPYYDDPYKILEDESFIFDRYFYKLANVPYEKKWENFYFERNLDREKEVFYDILKLTDDSDFIFVHEDVSRNFKIKEHYIDQSKTIIRPSEYLDISVLDFLYTIEKASEVHVINSVFRTFIDLMHIKHNKLYYHKYTRDAWSEQPGCKLNWKILDE